MARNFNEFISLGGPNQNSLTCRKPGNLYHEPACIIHAYKASQGLLLESRCLYKPEMTYGQELKRVSM